MRWLLVTILALGLAACSDDDDDTSCGCTGNLVEWDETVLPPELVDGGVWALDASADRTIGLAVSSSGSWIIEQTPDGWVTVGDQPLPGTFAAPPRSDLAMTTFATDAVIDGTGKVQVVGLGALANGSIIWSEGDPDWAVAEDPTPFGLQAVVALGAQDIVATGTGQTAILTATGSVYDELVFATVSTAGDPNEKGLIALTEFGGTVYGCGFDDGGDGSANAPWRIIMQYAAGEWTQMESPCGPCGSIDMRAIEASPTGLYVGGVNPIIPTGAPVQEVAWLVHFSATAEEWTEIVLPSADELRRVNDILVASDGTVYLACGNEDSSAYLVSAVPGEEPVIEWSNDTFRLFSLAETADGKILAAGLEPGDPAGMPVLIERAK